MYNYFKCLHIIYGIPQQRERVYFICIRSDIYVNDVKLLVDKQNTIDYKKYLLDYNLIEEKYKITGDILNVLNAWQEMIDIFEVGEKISPVILAHEFYKTYTSNEFLKLKKMEAALHNKKQTIIY